jgi:two-component system, response regulator YesN
MFKIVLADDEKYVLVVIKSILNELSIPVEVVGEAYDGEEAYELCQRLHPDILITDICMPRENGLDLIKKIRITMPSIQIIILSGYNDFSYAKQAIHFGVSEYLLKPVDEGEVYKAIDKINKELSKTDHMDHEQGIYNAFNEIIHASETILRSEKDYYESYVNEFRFDTLGILILYDRDSFIDKARLYHCKVILDQQFGGYVCENKKDSHELICFFSKAAAKNKIQEDVAAVQKAILQQGYGDILISYAINRFDAVKVLTVKSVYTKARQALEAFFWYQQEQIFTEEGFDFRALNRLTRSNDQSELILLSVRLMKKEYTINIVKSYLESIIMEYEYGNPVEIKQLMWRLLEKAMEVISLPSEFRERMNRSKADFFSVLSKVEAKERVLALTAELMDTCGKQNGNDNQENFAQAMKDYIHRNYNKDIDLESLAAHLHFNSSYLSSLFKKKTGCNFSRYVTEVRIEHAKKLLESNEFKVLEISEQVGYLDTKYFTKMFKHMTGMTPSEYQLEYKKNTPYI